MPQGPHARAASGQAQAGPGCMSRVARGCLLILCATLAAQILLLAHPPGLSAGVGFWSELRSSQGGRGGSHTQRLVGRGSGRRLWENIAVSRAATLRQSRSSGRALVGLRGRMGKQLLVDVAPAQGPSESALAPSPAGYGHAASTPVPAATLGAPLPAPEAQVATVPPAVGPAPEPRKESPPPPVLEAAPPKVEVQATLPPKAEAPKPPPPSPKKKSPPPSAPPPRKSVAGAADVPKVQAPQAKTAAPKAAPAPQVEAAAPKPTGNKEAQGNAPLGSNAAGDGRGGQNAGAPASMQYSPPRPPWPPFPSSPPPNPPSPPPVGPPPAPSPSGLPSPPSEGSAVSTGLIVAAAVGGGALLLALTALGFFCYCMAGKRRQDELGPLSAIASDSKMAGNLSTYSPSSYGAHTPAYGIPGTASAGSMPGYPYASSGMPESAAMPGAGALAAGASGASLAMLSSPGGRSTHSQVSQGQSWFSYEELEAATGGFALANKLGEGGFGKVYKGVMLDGRVVAVKALTLGGGQGEREFRAEVEIISRVHHRYLVTLLGYCIARDQRLLVYEYVPNGTLESALHAGKGRPVMSWSLRMKCAVGAAKGLAYLHEDCHPRIIHRDIKSSNILLDGQHEAQVADFGLAKLAADNTTHVSTRVMGTFGYLAPEYAMSGKLTDKSDVFSFGVVLLELISGRRPVDPTQAPGKESLVEWARPLLAGNEVNVLVDSRLEGRYDDAEMERMVSVAALCVRHSSGLRPRMGQVVRMLEGAAEMPHAGAPPGMSMMYEGSPFGGPTQNFDSAIYSAEMRQQYPNGTATPSPASSYGGAPRVGTGRTSSLGRAAEYSPSRPLPSEVDIMGPGAYDMHLGMPHIDRVTSAHGSARDTQTDIDSMSAEEGLLGQNRADSTNSLPLPPGRMAPALPSFGVPQDHLERPQLGGWSARKPIPEGAYGGEEEEEEEDEKAYAQEGENSGFLGYGNGQSTGFDQLAPQYSTTSGVSEANWSVQVSEKLREGR